MTEHALPISSSTRVYESFEHEATHQRQASSVPSIPSRRPLFSRSPVCNDGCLVPKSLHRLVLYFGRPQASCVP
jgi:hypothetical protein